MSVHSEISPVPKHVLGPTPNVVRHARGVADALTRLDGAKYTSEERPARIALERAARSLREALRKR
ncbi:hypothetical protein [Mesorhizobium sp.]|uniref:hypothetical protein n=1 Tax=Mesorhizobium sp. TaxID=1871066 RepID=UPI000FEA6CD8|nr:hypothetical protein [Mesorhizobium sp.]RWE37464.1 MAG: hypothetical protein EOS77_02475 [Mesorhizobium sp.]